jgi:hypothetical protein
MKAGEIASQMGGLGIMAASGISVSAFISSVMGAANLTSKLLPAGYCSQART